MNTKNPISFENQMIYWCEDKESKTIKMIVDEKNIIDKPNICDNLEIYDYALTIQHSKTMNDIMSIAMSMRDASTYIIDMPTNEEGAYIGLETLKGGLIHITRKFYNGRLLKTRPQVIVFTNKKPDTAKMTEGKWKIFSIQEDGCLISLQ